MPTSPERGRSIWTWLRRARARARDRSGVTLVELVLSIVIIGVTVTGTLLAINRTVRSSADPMIVKQALAIGEAYLEEILLKDYYDPEQGAGAGICPAVEASRDLYDNLCDYDTLDDSGARDHEDNAIAGLEGYRVRVSVETAAATLGALTGDTEVVRVDVRVTHSDVVDLTLSGYRTNF